MPLPLLSLSNYTFGRDDVPLYPQSPLSLEVSAGELISVTGASGSGKSTFLHSLFDPNLRVSGSISWSKNKPIFGYMPQNANQEGIIFSACDVVALGRVSFSPLPDNKSRRSAYSLLERLGIPASDKRRLNEFSGGEQQRIMFARALHTADTSKIVLLDEPTSNLDEGTKNFLNEQIATFREDGYSFITITHDLNFAITYSSQMLALTSGKASVLPANEIESSGVIDALLGGSL
jgi:ABC-type Mn2+/Zn2+ transport system ATPase subunit